MLAPTTSLTSVRAVPSVRPVRALTRSHVSVGTCSAPVSGYHTFSKRGRSRSPRDRRTPVVTRAFGITFGIPGAIQTEINNDFGGLAPLVSLVLFVYVNGQIQKFRREQEEKAMKAAGEAMSEAAKETVEGITQEQWAKLALCVLIDLAGDSSFLLPGLGELSDGVYAPIEAFALNSLFSSGALGGIGFVEEALPFSDALPTATVAWMLQTLAPESGVTKALGIKPPSPKEKTSEVTEE
ncbi:hypothetical protein NFJ02_33g84460 [Pycnococcus provasolii]